MKTTAIAASLFRSVSALCLCAGLLFTTSPAFASGSPEPGKPAVAAKKSLADELADRVEAKANFAARIAPRLARAENEFRYSSRYDTATLIDWLWALRSDPALQRKWLDTITDPADGERVRTLNMFSGFMEETWDVARDLERRRSGNVWRWFRDAFLTPSHKDGPDKSTLAETASKLAEAKARERAFADALVLTGVYRQAGVSPHEGREFSGLLLKLKDRPEELAMAASLIRDGELSPDRFELVLHTLATDPDAVRDTLEAMENAVKAEKRYRFATRTEGLYFFTQLPLSNILPDAVKPVEKRGTIPLAASRAKGPEKTLSVTRTERLSPENFSLRDTDGGFVRPPFLQADERLYVVWEQEGTPVFANTPLAVLSGVGPKISELTTDTIDTIAPLFGDGVRHDNHYLVAAACGPEELAAHIAGLSVMVTARESSLYGPYEDFLWKPEKDRWFRHSDRRRVPKEIPADIPGEAARLVNIRNKSLFLTLAPIADKEGLARLMGPVRGVWARSGGACDPLQWTELRYAGKSGKARAFALGTAPLLKLDKPAVQALNADLEQYVLHSWTNYEQRELAETDMALCREKFPAALADVDAKFAPIRAKGFVSPLNASMALYFLEEYGKDADTLEKLRAVLDDTSRSSVKRVEAMEDIALGKKND